MHFHAKSSLLHFLLSVLILNCGCAATQIALEKKDLKVETRMSDTIFLDIESEPEKTVFVALKNTSGKDIDIAPYVIQKLQQKGYVLKSSPKEAYYILQGNILYVGVADPTALEEVLASGPSSIISGADIGGLIGTVLEDSGKGLVYGAGIGGLAGGVADHVSGSLVKDVTYTIVADLMISERSEAPVEQTFETVEQKGFKDEGADVTRRIIQQSQRTSTWRKYQTRIVSTANKANLKLEEAINPLIQELSKSIAGTF
ncbi:MAG TPA: complement resistance protein TraT [Candidatus Brocadiia bacterium]|nr:complement resistance protein TraT [Candidatus Brocadiales bacterium]